MGEVELKDDVDVEKVTQMSLQIADNARTLEAYISQYGEDDEIDYLIGLNERAAQSLESRVWPIRYVEEILSTLDKRMDGLGSRHERYFNRPCRDIHDYVRTKSISTLPPPG